MSLIIKFKTDIILLELIFYPLSRFLEIRISFPSVFEVLALQRFRLSQVAGVGTRTCRLTGFFPGY